MILQLLVPSFFYRVGIISHGALSTLSIQRRAWVPLRKNKMAKIRDWGGSGGYLHEAEATFAAGWKLEIAQPQGETLGSGFCDSMRSVPRNFWL